MKVFLVFISLFMINVSFLSFQGDMNRYIQLRTFLKYQAEECAASAALYYDEESYGNGVMAISMEEATEYMDYTIEQLISSPMIPSGAELLYDIVIQDDEKGYLDEDKIPSVTVTLHMDTPDLFRLPFLEVIEVERKARYLLSPIA
ncbi:MAG: hypothetical protein ACOX4U_07435 [Anaerovoracaceae bacterium]